MGICWEGRDLGMMEVEVGGVAGCSAGRSRGFMVCRNWNWYISHIF